MANFHCAILVICFVLAFMTSISNVDARRNLSSNQRKPSSSSSGHVTQQPGSSSNGNSHADIAKLSYPNYNSQPNRPPSSNNNPPQPGWNVPKDNGPPPAYSASNPVGGARTNINEPPPSYHQPNYAAAPPQPNYGASNMHNPSYGTQYAPPGATYHSPGSLPPGATYYPSGSHNPAGGYQPGAVGGSHSYYPPAGAMPQGATYIPAGGALPPGATYMSQPPQSSSSGLGFGTGLIAGGLGGALLGHALTPTQTHVEQAPQAAGGNDRIIIINNGVPVNATDGVTVVNATPDMNAANGTQDASSPSLLAPFSGHLAPMANVTEPANLTNAEQPTPGGIICVPIRVNETDPTDASKMIEIEKVACYPAPSPPSQEPIPQSPVNNQDGSVPLAPMLQPDQAAVRANNSSDTNLQAYFGIILITLISNLFSNKLLQKMSLA